MDEKLKNFWIKTGAFWKIVNATHKPSNGTQLSLGRSVICMLIKEHLQFFICKLSLFIWLELIIRTQNLFINQLLQIWYQNYEGIHLLLFIYVLWSSGISSKTGALIVRYSQKKKQISFVFCCFENHSIAHNFGTTGLIQVGFSAKCTSPMSNWIK